MFWGQCKVQGSGKEEQKFLEKQFDKEKEQFYT